MKKIFFFFFASTLMYSVSHAQVNVTILLKKPVPRHLSELQTDPTELQLILNNTTPNPYSNCKITMKIKDSDGAVVARTKDTDISMPKFNIPAAPQVLMLSGTQLISSNALYIDPSIKTAVTTTNSLPEGSYQLCIDVYDSFGSEISTGGEKCEFFEINFSDPPSLIAPANQEILTNNFPQLSWTPVVVSPYIPGVQYRLRVAKMFVGQSAKNAIESNTPILDKFVSGTSYQYLQGDIDIDLDKTGKPCAWQVQAVNSVTHLPIEEIGNSGMSEAWSFIPPSGNPATLKLVAPADNAYLSPIGDFYTFTWDSKKQIKTITSFIIKIAEVKTGQTPEKAILVNTPVYLKDDIHYSLQSTHINKLTYPFIEQHKYAWQIFAYSTSYNGIIDTSKVWSFTAKNTGMDVLNIESPLNNSTFAPDTGQYQLFRLKWNTNNIVKTITNYNIKIVPYIAGQGLIQALTSNTPVYNKTGLSTEKFHVISSQSGILENDKKYVWILEATSTSYNNNVIAKSEPSLFTVTGAAVLADSVKTLELGKYILNVKTVTNKNANQFTGTAEVLLWVGGPQLTLPFQSLKIVKGDPAFPGRWKVTGGEIWATVNPTEATLIVNEGIPTPKLTSTLSFNTVRLDINRSTIFGKVKLKTPLLKLEGNSPKNLIIESTEKWINIDPVSRFNDTLQSPSNPDINLYDPSGYKLAIIPGSKFLVHPLGSRMILEPRLKGVVTLPVKFKNTQNENISIHFEDIFSFNFNIDLKNLAFYYKITTNNDLVLNAQKLNVDLYNGKVYVSKGAFVFDYTKFGMSPFEFTTSTIYFAPSGFNSSLQITTTGSSWTKFRGYKYITNSFYLNIGNGNFDTNCHLKGKVIIPFIKQSGDLTLYFTKNGITSSSITGTAAFVNKDLNLYTGAGGFQKLDINIQSIVYSTYDNKFWLNAYMTYKNSKGEGLITDPLAVNNVNIDSNGVVKFSNLPAGQWQVLNVNKAGKYNGFPLTIKQINVSIYNSAYHFNAGGDIILADNLSNTGGTKFAGGVAMPMNTGGMVPLEGDGIESSPIAAEFGNNESDFVCIVKWFQNDPVYGKGFMAINKIKLHSPAEMEADSKILIGKTNNGNGFAYWYLEAGVVLPYNIPCGNTGLGFRSFRGKIYSHMKQSGTLANATYVPDPLNKFGIFGEVGMEDVSSGGNVIWGKVSFELRIGSGFSAQILGHVNVLASGFEQEDGYVKGDAVITFSSNPKLFDADFIVNVDVAGTFCATGRLQFHIDEDIWFMHIGTKEQPISTNLLCSMGGYNTFFTVDKNSTQFGVGYYFDTGEKRWGEVMGCFGRANGGMGANATLTYSPFQFSGSGYVSAHVVIGVFIDLEVWSGRKTLLNSNWEAAMEMTMPDPFCVAGKIHGSLCFDPCPIVSCDICAGATLKVRYKDGSFALKSTCND